MIALQGLLWLCLAAFWVYTALCIVSARSWRNRTRSPSAGIADLPPVTILKPLCGTDPEQHDNFESFCRLDYPVLQIVFGALDPSDEGLATARSVADAHPECDIAIVSGGQDLGLNRKVCNLDHMMGAAKHDLLVLCDSDMRVTPDYGRRIVASFADPSVGLVTCPYRGAFPQTLAARLEALAIGADFIPSVLLAAHFSDLSFALGATVALRRSTLEQMGGFRRIADELADDHRMGNLVHALGKRVVLSEYVVDDVMGRETWRRMWARRVRWARTARAMAPLGWIGAFVTHGQVVAMLLLAASAGGHGALWALAVTIAYRALAATWIARRYTRDWNLPGGIWLLPLADIFSFAVWFASFTGRGIEWRGERYVLGKNGLLTRK